MKAIGDIARELGVEVHQVDYVVNSRKIPPAGRAGAYRLFGPVEIAQIRKALDETAAARGGGASAPHLAGVETRGGRR